MKHLAAAGAPSAPSTLGARRTGRVGSDGNAVRTRPLPIGRRKPFLLCGIKV